MMRRGHVPMTRRRAIGAAAALALAAGGVGGCAKYRENKDRPPVPLNVSISVQDGALSVSPSTFGAGPTVFTISNINGDPVTIHLDSEAGAQEVGPIASRTPRAVRATMAPGTHEITATADSPVESASVLVGPERPTSQDVLLLP